MKYFDKDKSLTFLCLYMESGKKLYRSSRIKEDRISKENGMQGLEYRFIRLRHKGQFSYAIICDNTTKEILKRFDENGNEV